MEVGLPNTLTLFVVVDDEDEGEIEKGINADYPLENDLVGVPSNEKAWL